MSGNSNVKKEKTVEQSGKSGYKAFAEYVTTEYLSKDVAND